MKTLLKYVLCGIMVIGIAMIQIPRINAENGDEEIVVEEVVYEDAEVEEMIDELFEEEERLNGEIAGEEAAGAEEAVEEVVEEVSDEALLEDDEEMVEYVTDEAAPIEEFVGDADEETEPFVPVPGESFEYIIVKGDCLWFIAGRFYKDPFLWPQIYEANPYIKDPHWIFPDDTLLIPGIAPQEEVVADVVETVPVADEPEPVVEKTIAVVEEEYPVEEEEPFEETAEAELEADIIEEEIAGEEEIEIITMAEEKLVEIDDTKKYQSLSFVAPLDWQFDGYVIGEESQKLMVSQGDDVYIDIGQDQGMLPNTRCIIYRPGRKIKDRTTGKILGRVVRKIAIVRTGYDIENNVATARVITSYDYIRPGDMVRLLKN